MSQGGSGSTGVIVLRDSCPGVLVPRVVVPRVVVLGVVVLFGDWQRGSCPMGVIVLRDS